MSHPYGVGLVSSPFAIVNGQTRFNPRATEEQELLRAAKLSIEIRTACDALIEDGGGWFKSFMMGD